MSRYPLIAAILFLCAAPTSAQLQLARIDGTVLGPTDEALLRSRGVSVQVLQDPTCIRLMSSFIAAHPELWNEDIGV